MSRGQSKFPRIIFSKGLFFILIVLLLFFSFSLLREIKNKKEIQAEIKLFEQELVDLNSNNQELQSLIDYLKTDEYAELEAKRKLGMKKEGENVVLVTESEILNTKIANESANNTNNILDWWQYFFN